MYHWGELLQQTVLVLGNFSREALPGLKQMCSWTWSNQGSHSPVGSAAFSCLTCTSRSQLEFGSLHNTAAAAAGLQHLIPVLAMEAVFPLANLAVQGQAWSLCWAVGTGKSKDCYCLVSGLWNWELLVRGETKVWRENIRWFGMKSISFCELDGILTPVTEYQQMAFISSAIYANWSF